MRTSTVMPPTSTAARKGSFQARRVDSQVENLLVGIVLRKRYPNGDVLSAWRNVAHLSGEDQIERSDARW